MKLACVVHRFGAGIAGGSEGHCRAVAAQLAARHGVTVLTTCAADHVSWKNAFPPGASADGPLAVRRFPVARQRSLHRFTEISERAFDGQGDEEQWFRENGPDAPQLVAHLRAHAGDYDRILFWAFRYATSYFGLPVAGSRGVLVPTAEDDPVIRFAATERFFSQVPAFVFLTPEEAALVARHGANPAAPSCIIGTGVAPAPALAPVDLKRHDIAPPFLLYLGRIDPNKGCDTLFRHFLRWQEQSRAAAPLVLAGPANMPVPAHPRIKYLGYVNDTMRETLLSTASALVVPSPYESLSLVLLEAWNHATPALVNGACDVLRGQAVRSGGALYYRTFDEFARAVEYLLQEPEAAGALGESGLAYVEREYRWPKVIDTLETFLASL